MKCSAVGGHLCRGRWITTHSECVPLAYVDMLIIIYNSINQHRVTFQFLTRLTNEISFFSWLFRLYTRYVSHKSAQHERRISFVLNPSKLQRLTFQTFQKVFDLLILRNHTTIRWRHRLIHHPQKLYASQNHTQRKSNLT